jgi:hypothetical protein
VRHENPSRSGTLEVNIAALQAKINADPHGFMHAAILAGITAAPANR